MEELDTHPNKFERVESILRVSSDSSSSCEETIDCDEECMLEWCKMMNEMKSPLIEMQEKYPTELVNMTDLFISSFINYYREDGDDSIEILEWLVQNPHNSHRLILRGMLGLVFDAVPDSFEAILKLIDNEQGPRYVCNDPEHLSIIMEFASQPEHQFIISQILYKIVLELRYFEESAMDMFNTLLHSDDYEVVCNTLQAIIRVLEKRDNRMVDLMPLICECMNSLLEKKATQKDMIHTLRVAVPMFEDITGVLELVIPLIYCTDESTIQQVIIFFEEVAKYNGIDIFPPEIIEHILSVSDELHWDCKKDIVWMLHEMIRKGTAEFHMFLVERNIFEFFSGLLRGEGHDDTISKLLESILECVQSALACDFEWDMELMAELLEALDESTCVDAELLQQVHDALTGVVSKS